MKEEAKALFNEIVDFGGYQVTGALLAAAIRSSIKHSYDGTGKLSISKLCDLSNELEKL